MKLERLFRLLGLRIITAERFAELRQKEKDLKTIERDYKAFIREILEVREFKNNVLPLVRKRSITK